VFIVKNNFSLITTFVWPSTIKLNTSSRRSVNNWRADGARAPALLARDTTCARTRSPIAEEINVCHEMKKAHVSMKYSISI
jgi:hypothetical protein